MTRHAAKRLSAAGDVGCARKWPGGRPRRNGLHLPAHVRHERGERKKDGRGGGRAHLPAHGVQDGGADHHHHQPCGRARYQPRLDPCDAGKGKPNRGRYLGDANEEAERRRNRGVHLLDHLGWRIKKEPPCAKNATASNVCSTHNKMLMVLLLWARRAWYTRAQAAHADFFFPRSSAIRARTSCFTRLVGMGSSRRKRTVPFPEVS